MASMDLETIIRDLNKRFAAPLPEFYKRRIIFWYDEDREFEDKLDDIQVDNAKLLVLTGTNNFAVKKLLNVDDTTSNYLVYSPISYESQEDNWLLNIELYSEEFRADLVSIWMNEIDLPATPDFRRLVKVYKKFFGAQNRRATFAKLNKGISTPSQMHLTVMAAICGTDNAQPNSIVKAVIGGGTNMETNEVFQSLVNYGAEAPFWALVKQATGYFEGECSTINKLVTHILLTATTRTLRMEYLAGLDSFISTPHQAWCYDFVSEWITGNNKQELVEILRNVEEELVLRKRFKQVPLDDLVGTEVFPCVNECILTQIMTEISNHTIAVRRMADGYLKLLYPDGSFTKEEVEEVLQISLEMRRRVKEQLKKLGGMEFYDVNFSYIDNETFEEHYVSVPEQGGGKLIPEGMCNPGQIYTISQGKSGMLGVFRLESQMLPGNGKFERTGIGSDRDAKESTNTAFNFLKANGNRISGSISTATKDYIINYQDLQGIGMTGKLALPTLIAMCSIALGKPTLSSLAVLGEISISGTMMKVDELANSLQVCLDSGAKRVLLPITSAAELGTVPADLIGSFNLIFYSSAEDAVFKALGVE